MTRRSTFVRRVRGERDERGRYASAQRRRKPIEWFAMGMVVCTVVAALFFERPDGAVQAILADASPRDGRLTTTVLKLDELERDWRGRFNFEGFGGAAPRVVPIAIRREVSTLREHRDRAQERRQIDLRRRPFPDLPIGDDAPPRMDSGHPDPDRVLPSSRPVTESVR